MTLRLWIGLVSMLMYMVLANGSVGETTTNTLKQENSSTHSLFTIDNSDRLTIYFGQPFNAGKVKVYVDKSVENFTIFITSLKPHIVTVTHHIIISPCEKDGITTSPPIVSISGESGNANHSSDGYSLAETGAAGADTQNTCYTVTFNATSVYLGFAKLRFSASYNASEEGATITDIEIGLLTVRSIRHLRQIDFVFRIAIYFVVAIVTLAMGTDIDFPVIKEHLKRPKAPIIGLISQFTFMPLLSYAVIHIMGYTGGMALGFFALGCSPGGGSSNMYSKLLNGNLSLSVTMTTISTVMSLAMMPFWLYTLGTTIPGDDGIGKIQVPFLSILTSLAVLIAPLLVGTLIRFKLPRVADRIRKCLKIIFIIIVIFFFTVGIYSNMYIFKSFTAEMVFSASVLPYGGYIFGGLFACLCRMEWKIVKTIAFETGLQNVGLCILVVKAALEEPDSDLAIIAPMAAMLMSTAPFYIIVPIYLIRERMMRKKKGLKDEEEIVDENCESGSSSKGDNDKKLSDSLSSSDPNDNGEKKLAETENELLLVEDEADS